MNIKLDKMRYQPNVLSYYLGFLAIAFDVLYLFAALNTLVPSLATAVKILLNIVLMLMTFLAIEKCKKYAKEYSIVLIVFGIISLLRLLYVPLQVYLSYDLVDETGSLVSNVIKTIVPIKDLIRMIVYLIVMSACFLTSGLFCYVRSIKLEKYVASLEKKEIK